jgi:hypothetical protein
MNRITSINRCIVVFQGENNSFTLKKGELQILRIKLSGFLFILFNK